MFVHRSLAAILCSVFLAGLTAAPSAMAQTTAGIDIPYKKFVLKNGLTLLVHEDHKAPSSPSMCGTTSARRTRSPGARGSPTCSST